MEARHKDCMPCRLASGTGIIGIGIYLFAQSRKHLRKPIHRNIIAGFAFGTVGLGVARLFDLLPKEPMELKKKPEENVPDKI